jgi:hypothetical protein
VVEATEGCDINLGKYARRMQVPKIHRTNFVNLHYKEITNPQASTKFLHENGKVGRVTFFSLK